MDERRIFYRAAIIVGLLLPLQLAHGAAAPMKVTLHIPSKSLSIMPYYFGKDKGFFAAEQIEPSCHAEERKADRAVGLLRDLGDLVRHLQTCRC